MGGVVPGVAVDSQDRVYVARRQSGDLFVADGYGQFRVHRLSPDGQVLSSWGDGGRDRANSPCHTASG